MKFSPPIELTTRIVPQVLVLRGQRVLLAQQLGYLYDIDTKVLNQAVKRNVDRFPTDFMFVVEKQELADLRSQFVTLNGAGAPIDPVSRSQFVTLRPGSHPKYLPYAFTELGIAMLSSILKSERAVAVNIEIMRAFVRMRAMLSEHQELRRKLNLLERKYDEQFKIVFDAIHELMTPPSEPKKRQIGFVQDVAKSTKAALKKAARNP